VWIVNVALKRPYTFIVLALLILLISPLVILRTPTDIFPNINIPVVSILFNYTGLGAEEMEQRITSVYERILTTTVNDIEHIESQSLNGIGGIVFADGTIGNAGLGPLMRDALGPAVDDPAIAREIDYSSLSGTATIARGTLRNRDLKLLSPRLSATAAGTLDLAARRIDYLLQPDIPGLGSARIAVTGSWDAPIYKALSVTITKGMKQPERQPR